MRTDILLKIAISGACYVLISTAQAAGDPEMGKYKFSTCAGCHGVPGYTNVYPTYHVPKLGGQHAEYITIALKEYQAGNRQHPTMHANAFTLSEQDMADIAAYVSSIDVSEEKQPVKGNITAGKQKSATCATCHGEDGNGNKDNPNPTFPRLAGQHEDYLRKALEDYKSGDRKNAIMSGMAAPLSAQDQADLAAYFASQENGLTVVKNGRTW
jgi:cytochrome c553